MCKDEETALLLLPDAKVLLLVTCDPFNFFFKGCEAAVAVVGVEAGKALHAGDTTVF